MSRSKKRRTGKSRQQRNSAVTNNVYPESVHSYQTLEMIAKEELQNVYDENLLERSWTQWQFGDWESLSKLQRQIIESHPDRAKLALLAAAGHIQVGCLDLAREHIRKARDWGCSKQLVRGVLTAGVYNSLGRAAALAGKQSKAIDHFEKAVANGTHGGDLRLTTWARITNQLDQIEYTLNCNNLEEPCSYERVLSPPRHNVELNTHRSDNNFPPSLSPRYLLSPRSFELQSSKRTLAQLFAQHSGKVSDKWESYLTEYEQVFSEYRNKIITLLEIGVQNGGSLEIWSQYFPFARKIIGCDINKKCSELEYSDSKIAIVIGNVNTDETEQIIRDHTDSFDIIIDDGSHCSSDIVVSFCRYFNQLNYGGVYLIEDLHCSYWQKNEGGLYAPYSSMAFFKRLADIVNHEHWGISKQSEDYLEDFFAKYNCHIKEETLKQINSVKFTNSLCIIHKETSKKNTLGRRVISGSLASIDEKVLQLGGSNIPKRDEANNPFANKPNRENKCKT